MADARNETGKPNPGSRDALKQGCTCAVIDNNHGKFSPFLNGEWWITEGCPVHAPKVTNA